MKTILVTGASGGIGSEIARLFAQNGYAVAINYNKSFDNANQLFQEITSCGGHAILCKADLKNEVEINNMIQTIIKEFGHIDVLVNNAGISYKGLFIDESLDKTQSLLNVNLLATINLCKNVIPFMLKNEKGKIVNISSIWGNCGASMEVTYSASKAGVIGLTKSLAKEYGYNNITVNCICPGVIETKMNNNLSRQEKEELIAQIPAGRFGIPKEIAELVYFLSEPSGDYINGQVITIDGGFTL